MEALRGLSSKWRSTGETATVAVLSAVAVNGTKAGVRRGRRGEKVGMGSVKVSSIDMGQIKAE
jgi:hypothetical protein